MNQVHTVVRKIKEQFYILLRMNAYILLHNVQLLEQ